MSASALSPSLAAAAPRRFSEARWIISKRDDLVWFIGAGLVGYLALALLSAGVSLTLLTAIWIFGVDGPHVTGTITRTYFDKQERRRLGWLLWALVPLLLLGPLAVLAGQGAFFFLFAVCWQHYHITKQHVGFVMLWRVKNREREAFEMKMDRWFVLASGVIPLALFVVKTRLSGSFANLWSGVSMGAYVGLTLIYASFQIRKWRAGKLMNLPKILLLAVLVPLQWLAFAYAARFGPDGITRAGMALGLFHSLQYHRLMWFHNKNRYQAEGSQEKHGLAAVLGQKFGYYFAAAIVLYWVTNFLPQALIPGQAMQAALWGIAFMHYLLDSKIWRVRGDKELAAVLRM